MQFKNHLSQVIVGFKDTLKIQMSSANMLNYLVNDILDYSQLKNGKFRKMYTQFNIRQAIDEITMIMDYKAEHLGIRVKVAF